MGREATGQSSRSSDTFIKLPFPSLPVPEIELSEEQKKELQEKLRNMSPEELRELQKKQCVFCQIISGAIPAKKILENEQSLAILDINPAAPGHVLLLPKEHYAIMPQLPEEELSQLFLTARSISHAMLRGMKASGTNIFVANGLAAGQKAQHFLIHIIPRKEQDGIFQLSGKALGEEEYAAARSSVEQHLSSLLGIKNVLAPEKGLAPVGASPRKGKMEKAPTGGKMAGVEKGVTLQPSKGKSKERSEENTEPEENEIGEENAEREENEERKEKDKGSAETGGGVSLDDIASLFK